MDLNTSYTGFPRRTSSCRRRTPLSICLLCMPLLPVSLDVPTSFHLVRLAFVKQLADPRYSIGLVKYITAYSNPDFARL